MTDYLRFTFDENDPNTAAVFDQAPLWAAHFGFLLFSQLELRPNLNILDVACGTGFPSFELAQMHGNSCQVTGVDIWKLAIERARLKLKTYQSSNVRFLEVDATRLPFEDGTFDLIISNLGVNNFDDPATAMAECFRVAKPGARMVLTTNTRGHMSEFYAAFREVLLEFQNPVYLKRLQVEEAHRGTKASLSDMLQAAGFRVVKVREDQFQLRYLDGSAFFNHYLTKLGFLGGWKRIVDQEDEEHVFALLENRLNQLARVSGEIRMTVPMLYLEAEK